MTELVNKQVGARLQAERAKRGWSRADVHERLGEGFTVGAVQAHEDGRNALKPAAAIAYADLYGLSLDWLLAGRDATSQLLALHPRFGRVLSELAANIRGHTRILDEIADELNEGRKS